VKPDVVVDIGNSRIKWGDCRSGKVGELFASLAGDNPEEWEAQLHKWELRSQLTWAVAGVQPRWQEVFTRWAEARGDRIQAVTHERISIPIEVDEPKAVGIDRLLNALAANRMKPTTAQAIVISVGTAVTVDLVLENGSFAGGAIFPGPRLMAESLHQFTAKLPLVKIEEVDHSPPPGANTQSAIRNGISFAIMGGASLLVGAMITKRTQNVSTWVFMTGGALGNMEIFPFDKVERIKFCPNLTLEGIRIAAESLP
jgi:type III pantothenate kinase